MNIEDLKEEIILNIGTCSIEYRSNLAEQIIRCEAPMKYFIEILLEDHPMSTRFSWLLGGMSDRYPSKSKEIIIECYKILDQIKIKNFDRSLSKQIMICGDNLPVELEGTIVNHLFEWLIDTKMSVSTKSNCLFALENLCKKYPELTEEFIEVVHGQKELYSNDFKKRAEKVLGRLRKNRIPK